jgi:hypothetical protein
MWKMMEKSHSWNVVLVAAVLVASANADTALVLGGQVSSLLSPATTEVEAFGPCGIFNSGVPPLPEGRRDFGAALLGTDLVLCGGYRAITGGKKDCIALNLADTDLVWRDFAPLNRNRYQHTLVTIGGQLYAVGGINLAGGVKPIEMYNSEQGAWEDVGETYGTRIDSCVVPWGEDGLMMIGGYDDMGGEQHVEILDLNTMTWSKAANINTPRGLHACAVFNGGVIAAGGWTPDYTDPDYPTQVPTKTDEWYDPVSNTWTESIPMRHRRTEFGLTVMNDTLFAIGGYEGYYVDTIEYLREDNDSEGWSFHSDHLQQGKSAFGFVRISNMLEDPNC